MTEPRNAAAEADDFKDFSQRNKPVSKTERVRIASLMAMFPQAETVLEIGARFGRITKILASRYPRVVALDLERPTWELTGVETVQGDVRNLDFPDKTFDLVVCTEVLEHVPGVESAVAELVRVSRNYALIGVPFQQDTRVGQTTCRECGRTNPPYGHVNRFDEAHLHKLFLPMTPDRIERIGEPSKEKTNALSSWLMSRAGNPYGSYAQLEPCIHCDAKIVSPEPMNLSQRAAAGVAERIRRVQVSFAKPWAPWLHVLYQSAR
jgi:ubiquinone/menaquinone biosynthesis C-methylase UbiE